MGIHWTCCVCEKQVEEYMFDTEERMCDECLNHDDEFAPTEHDKISSGNNEKPQLYMMAWRKYCMESIIFRIFVKLGWRK